MTKERFYELDQFFGGYFHQDWKLDVSDWQSAVQSFIEGATPDRIKEVATQLGVLLSWSLDDDGLHEALLELGSAYYPGPEKSYRDWLYEVHDFLRRAVRPPPEPGLIRDLVGTHLGLAST